MGEATGAVSDLGDVFGSVIHRCLNHPQKSERHLEKSEHFKVVREVNKGEK